MKQKQKWEVAVIAGSRSDQSFVKEVVSVLKKFHISYREAILSAHREPERLKEFVAESEKAGVKVFIALAGLAAHLPGVIASRTSRPVLGVPISHGALQGMDALLSMVQMPQGVPVASMGIGGAQNAALFAIEILALTRTVAEREKIFQNLMQYRRKKKSKK